MEDKHFSVLVVGDNHEEVIKQFSSSKKSEPHIKYKIENADKYREAMIASLTKILPIYKSADAPKQTIGQIEFRINELSEMSPIEYYQELTNGMQMDEDGNALTDENINGHYIACKIGKDYSIPLRLKDGTETFSARKGDIDWNITNSFNKETYRRAWEIVVDGSEPIGEVEKLIKENMMPNKNYLTRNFPNKEYYVKYSSSFWTFAFVTDNEWIDADTDSSKNIEDWIFNYYDRFISGMDDNTLITIYECISNDSINKI